VNSNPDHVEVYSIQHYVKKFSVTCGRSVILSSGTLVSSTNKTDRHDITEIVLKVALSLINPTPTYILQYIRAVNIIGIGISDTIGGA
jgi:hypothetical protein